VWMLPESYNTFTKAAPLSPYGCCQTAVSTEKSVPVAPVDVGDGDRYPPR